MNPSIFASRRRPLPSALAVSVLCLVAALAASSGRARADALGPAVVPAALLAPGMSGTGTYTVPLYKSRVIPLDRAAKQVSVGNPGVADILVLRDREIYVVAKGLGSTNVVVWDGRGQAFLSFNVEVTHDLEALRGRLNELLPGEPVEVRSAQQRLLLSGQLSSALRMDSAVRIAEAFLPDCVRSDMDREGPGIKPAPPSGSAAACKQGGVVNLMQVGGAQQVMLSVTVAEMSRSVVKRLDSSFNLLRFGSHASGGAVNGGATFPDALNADDLRTPIFGSPNGGNSPIGPAIDEFAPNMPVIDGAGLFLGYLTGRTYLQAVLDISRRNGLAKILSEPTLTTLTGKPAQFLSGGEFPIPVPQGGSSNATTIEFKEFGVELRFTPTVLDSGHINLDLDVAVSELSADNNVILQNASTTSRFVIPSLTKRGASSVVELDDGQTIGIAGLISDNVRDYVEKLPGLGDIPILGLLFRSQAYQSGQTELVIFVTPHLAKPISRDKIRLPTEAFVPPSDFDFYFMGRTEAKQGMAASPSQLHAGSFGHRLDLPQP